MAQQATVLLRNLHEASTHASVAAALAEFGPVKRVDVIRGRGFGFVKFATAADAQKAVRAGRENGIDVDGAVVEVALARDKGQKHPNAVAAPIAPSNNEKRESQRSVRGRSARVFGIPVGASDKAVYKRLRKLEGFEKVTSVEGAAMRPAGALAVATFSSLQKASQACQRLDGATFKGSKLACRLEAHVDRSNEQKGRLVVRNLHFRALEEDLLDAFMAYGPLREARVPRVGEKSRGFGFVEFFCESDARRALKAASSGKFAVKGRPVAVDQATPKSDHVVAAPEPARREDGASASGDESEAAEASDAAEEDNEDAGGEESDAAEGDDDEESDDEEASEDKKPDDVAEGRTLFVRNVPYGATRKALAELFAKSGSIESVHVVKDKATGLGKGSCFVRYSSADSATNATMEAWALDARPLIVALAVDQSTASKLRDEVGPAKKRKLEHALVGGDRRHVALSREGLIQKGDPAAIGVPENDLKKRERARQEAATKLRNPLFHVNPQRLSIRNLAPHVDAALLKELIEAAGVSPKDVGAVHVARDKVPTVPGKKPKPGKSKGYAFAEFSSHACAMRVLRFANNNPELASYCVPRGKKMGSEVPRPIVAFVVEDHRKVALRQKREDDAKAKATAPLDGPSRKERRREKRIANRLEKKRARKGAEEVPKAPRKVVDDGLMRDRGRPRRRAGLRRRRAQARQEAEEEEGAGAGRRARAKARAAGLPRVAEEGRRRGRGPVVRVNSCVS
ncbi:unnamed protein product [Pelagomonas calceolata]|uniref:RRM domain-containing protein n=1 Tax=Pelagomonas calceolata TaxID=35677 RepID=A0A8J2T114_9STRA|nr:unnamed protein product [Pelagomonas calceolata]